MIADKVLDTLPHEIRRRVEPYVEAVQLMTQTNNAKVLRSMAPSGIRGLILQRGKQGVPTTMPSNQGIRETSSAREDFSPWPRISTTHWRSG